jgi:hypothetical protein
MCNGILPKVVSALFTTFNRGEGEEEETKFVLSMFNNFLILLEWSQGFCPLDCSLINISCTLFVQLTPAILVLRKLFRYNKFGHQFSEHAEVSASKNQSGPAPKNGRNFTTSNRQNAYVGVNLKHVIYIYIYSGSIHVYEMYLYI